MSNINAVSLRKMGLTQQKLLSTAYGLEPRGGEFEIKNDEYTFQILRAYHLLDVTVLDSNGKKIGMHKMRLSN